MLDKFSGEKIYREAKQKKLFEVLSTLDSSKIKLKSNYQSNQAKQNQWFEAIKFIWLPTNSRRRITLQIDDSGKIGFFAPKSHEIVEIESIDIATTAINAIFKPLKQLINGIKARLFKQIIITEFDSGIDLQLICINKPSAKQMQIIFDFAKTNKINISYRVEIGNFKSSKRNSAKNPSKIINYDLIPIFLAQTNYLEIEGLKLQLQSDVFLQATKSGLEAIMSELKAQLEIRKLNQKNDFDKIIELYAGFGAYSFALRNYAKNFEIFEGNEKMVEIAKKNAAINGLSHKIKAFTADIAKFPISAKQIGDFDALIINPPRSGAAKQITEIAKLNSLKNSNKPSLIIYISCNPQSFAFDSKILQSSGYQLSSLLAIDQFYGVDNFEIVASFNSK